MNKRIVEMIKIFITETESKMSSAIFIKHITNVHLGIAREKLSIDTNKYGKPMFVNFSDIYYSVSHTSGLIVGAISNSCIGIDVERIKPFNKRIVERFFSKNEREYVFSFTENQDERFAEIWTKKEAYVKWLGIGLEMFETFDIGELDAKSMYSLSYDSYFISVFSERLSQNTPEIIMS